MVCCACILVYGVISMSRSNIVLWVKVALKKAHQIKPVSHRVRMPALAKDLVKGCLLIAEKETGRNF